jgi:hypothetical protein
MRTACRITDRGHNTEASSHAVIARSAVARSRVAGTSNKLHNVIGSSFPIEHRS